MGGRKRQATPERGRLSSPFESPIWFFLLLHIHSLDPDDRIPGAFLALIFVIRVKVEGGKTPPAGPWNTEGEYAVCVGKYGLQDEAVLGNFNLCLFSEGCRSTGRKVRQVEQSQWEALPVPSRRRAPRQH